MGPWQKYQQPQQDIGRPVIREGAPRPAPQTAPQARKDILDVRETEALLPAKVRKSEAEAATAQASAGITPGWEAVDKKFGEAYADWKALGGFANVAQQVGQLGGAGRVLKEQNITGPYIGKIPEFAEHILNPAGVSTRQDVEQAIQSSLRAVLGAQFTAEESERLMARTYDPQLPEANNRIKIARLRLQLTQAAKAKEEASRYFEKNGTLRGWTGRLWSPADFDPERNSPRQPPRKQAGGGEFLGWAD